MEIDIPPRRAQLVIVFFDPGIYSAPRAITVYSSARFGFATFFFFLSDERKRRDFSDAWVADCGNRAGGYRCIIYSGNERIEPPANVSYILSDVCSWYVLNRIHTTHRRAYILLRL